MTALTDIDAAGLSIRNPHEMRVTSGRLLDPRQMTAADIDVNDIATALGNLCRFNGHVGRFYSVAEHAVRVARMLERDGWPPVVVHAGLHHDDPEAYYGDTISPQKRRLEYAFMSGWERFADMAIGGAFRIKPHLFHCPAVRDADRAAVLAEMAGGRRGRWSPRKARRLFLREHRRLTNLRGVV